MTRRQQQVLKFIAQCVKRHGYPPTVREICTRFGWASPNAAHCHLRALERAGAIKREGHCARAIRVVRL